jgi:hypothetical protein
VLVRVARVERACERAINTGVPSASEALIGPPTQKDEMGMDDVENDR